MTDYNVSGELDVTPTAKRAAGWMDSLAPYSPAISRTDRHRTEFVITVPAKDLEQAARTGLAILQRAAGPVLLETLTVMTTEEFDRRAEDVGLPDMVGATEAAEIIGVRRQRVQQMAESGALPSMKVGNALVFPRATVEAIARARADGKTVDG